MSHPAAPAHKKAAHGGFAASASLRICADCIHSSPATSWQNPPEGEPECHHELAFMFRSLTTGVASYDLAMVMRSRDRECGPEGRLWQPKAGLELGLQPLAQHAEGPGR